MSHTMPGIMTQDIPIFEDLLRTSSLNTRGDLMINSPGGDANTAEKILLMCRTRFSDEFNIVVPNFAKSAATMIALGADKIYMGYLSDLGPVDPQISVVLPNGQTQLIPARAYMDGLNMIRDRISKGDPPQVYLPILSQIRPEMIRVCQEAIDFSEDFLRRWLPLGALKKNPDKVEDIIKTLVSGIKYKSHGQVITHKDAGELGFNVELIDPKSDLWGLIWELYIRSIQFLNETPNGAKLFESDASSTTMMVSVQYIQASPRPSPPPGPPKPIEPPEP